MLALKSVSIFFLSIVLIQILLTDYVNGERYASRHLLNTNLSQWIVPSSPLLPRPDRSMLIASYNNTIFLFGGAFNSQQRLEFDINSQNMTDFGSIAWGFNIFGYSQYYTQFNEMVYWIYADSNGRSGDKVLAYNLKSKMFLGLLNGTMPIKVYNEGCLASNEQFLFAVGGYYNFVYLNTLQIYDIASQTWSTDVPYMQTVRRYHSCIVHPLNNALYAIAGICCPNNGDYSYLQSAEKIFIDDITNQNWTYTQDLLYHSQFSRAIIYQDSIVIIGGSNPSALSAIQVINCTNDQISLGGYLQYAISRTSVIIQNQKLYVFGGMISTYTKSLDMWQYLELPPTNEPTNSPTNSPNTYPSSSYVATTVSPAKSTEITLLSTQRPTSYPTININDTNVDSKHVQLTLATYLYISCILLVIILILSIFGIVHSKRNNYTFYWKSLFVFLVYLFDFISDLFFCVNLYNLCNLSDIYLILFILSLIFIFLPSLISLYGMKTTISRCIELNDDKLIQFFEQHSFKLYTVCFMIGNFPATLKLFGSNLLNLDLFKLSLSRHETLVVENKHFIYNVCFESIPQLIISIWYSLYIHGVFNNDMVMFTYIFGIGSLITSLFTFMTKRELLKKNNMDRYVVLHENVDDNDL